jgi:hypothetical protein
MLFQTPAAAVANSRGMEGPEFSFLRSNAYRSGRRYGQAGLRIPVNYARGWWGAAYSDILAHLSHLCV